MIPSNWDAFGSEFLPGQDTRNIDGASRAMERRYGGTVGTPINTTDSSWEAGFDADNNERTDTDSQ